MPAKKKASAKKETSTKTKVVAPAPNKKKSSPQKSSSGRSLVIVESPAKEKTLSKFLGRSYTVKSSFGHLRDLPKKDFGLDTENHFEPRYELLPRAEKIVPTLQKLASVCDTVYLATDFDREGESIAWHLKEVLELDDSKTQRITFHEITPEAIRSAIQNPRKVSQSLVDAQVARRVLDRIVGYRLSPLLWEKIRRGLSAGRVQSVAVRLISEREDEIEKFKAQEYWTVAVNLENTLANKKLPFLAQLTEWQGKKVEKFDVSNQDQSESIGRTLEQSEYVVTKIERKEKRRNPLPPFMTSTMAQESSRKLGFSAARTMRIAQTLYEGVTIDDQSVGLITYMRTDSLNVAKSAQEEALDFIRKKYGPQGLPEKPRAYKTKSKSAQEAHEAIRPTSPSRTPESVQQYLNTDQLKLYTLIWNRFIASQMREALYDTVAAEIHADCKGQKNKLRAFGSTLKEVGFLVVYGAEVESEDTESENKDGDKRLPELSESEPLKFLSLASEQHFTEPPPRFNEASLIKILEQFGIGRPSTYAPILETIQARGYVRLEEKRFHPTDLGRLVNQQLIQFFPEIVDTNFTARVEEKLDEIAEGQLGWHGVIDEFYQPFAADIEKAKSTMPRVRVSAKDSGEICPEDGGNLLIRESRFGRYLSCANFPKCRYKASLDASGKKVEPQTTDEKCPKCGSAMAVKMSRRGKFLACSAYPECKTTFSIDRNGNKIVRPAPVMTEKKCEKCGSGFYLRVGKRGPFLACSAFPKCRNIKRAEPEDIEKAEAVRAQQEAGESNSSAAPNA